VSGNILQCALIHEFGSAAIHISYILSVACYTVLQRVAGCCSVWQYVAVCIDTQCCIYCYTYLIHIICSVLQRVVSCVAGSCSVCQYVAMCVDACVCIYCHTYLIQMICSVLQRVAACCSVLQAVAVCGNMLQCALIHEFGSAAVHISYK